MRIDPGLGGVIGQVFDELPQAQSPCPLRTLCPLWQVCNHTLRRGGTFRDCTGASKEAATIKDKWSHLDLVGTT